MGFWGAVVGGIVGAAVGGPLGAAGGVARGMAFGDDDDTTPEGLPELPMELQWLDDSDGRVIALKWEHYLPGLLGFRVDIIDSEKERFIKGRPPYRDDDGDFFVIAGANLEHLFAGCYVPLGAAKIPHTRPLTMRVLALGENQVLSCSMFELPWPRGAYSRARMLRPIVGLAMRVARADGRLDRSEVALIRSALIEAFELDDNDHGNLRDLMKSEPSAAIEQQIEQIGQRFPDIEPDAIVGLLAQVAHADGEIHAAEVEVIRAVAIALGAPPQDWEELAEALELVPAAARLAAACRVLGLQPGASLREVKQAYRAKMHDYHPDKVAHLASEFQEVAKRKSQELNEAYRVLQSALR